jgi:hypothetical protein
MTSSGETDMRPEAHGSGYQKLVVVANEQPEFSAGTWCYCQVLNSSSHPLKDEKDRYGAMCEMSTMYEFGVENCWH